MKRREKEALKKAFGIPEPVGADAFFERPEFAEIKEDRRRVLLFRRIPAALRYGSIALAAVAVIGVWGGFKNWADINKADKTERPAVVETSPVTTSDADNIIVTEPAFPQNNTDVTTAPDEDSSAVTTAVSGEDISVTTVQTTALSGGDTRQTTASSKPSNGKTTTTKRSGSRTTSTTARQSGNRTTTTAANPVTVRTTTPAASVTPALTTVAAEVPVPATTNLPVAEDPVTNDTPESGKVDYTVRPDVVYNVSGRVVTVDALMNDGSNSPEPNTPIENNSPAPSLDQLVRMSDLIVTGVVEEVIYTSENGYPVTQTNIRITDWYYGYAELGMRISVRSRGGYMPVKDYAPAAGAWYPDSYRDAYVFDNTKSAFLPEEGKEYTFFLTEDNDLFRLCTDNSESVYYYDNDYGKLVCLADRAVRYTYSNVYEAVRKIK